MKSSKKQGAQQNPSRTYEEVAAYLLNRFRKEFGLKFVEGKQKIKGQRSGTTWTIDAKGIREGDEAFLIVECRRNTTSKQNQEKAGGLAYRIIDTGTAGGIIVSPLELQEGAAKVAAAENILRVQLNANSTPNEFAFQFLDKLCLGIRGKVTTSGSVSPRYLRACAKCGKKFEVSGDRLFCNDCDA
ncbi:MAG: hypothetical protein WB586_23315 [Chthoniobacterales bacterium]